MPASHPATANPATVEAVGSGMAIFHGLEVLLCPAETIAHAFGQHGDGTRGSAFDAGIADAAQALSILASALASGAAASSGAAIQADAGRITGRDALIVDGRSTPGAFLVKEDSGHSVLAPALEAEAAPTSLISAIALPTFDAQFVDPTQGVDGRVARALAQGRLRTIVTFYPGRSILPDGSAVPRAAEFASRGIALACSKQAIDESGFRAGPRFFELDPAQRGQFVAALNSVLAGLAPQTPPQIQSSSELVLGQSILAASLSAAGLVEKLRAGRHGEAPDAAANAPTR